MLVLVFWGSLDGFQWLVSGLHVDTLERLMSTSKLRGGEIKGCDLLLLRGNGNWVIGELVVGIGVM